MNQIRLLTKLLLSVMIIGMVVTACQDEFSEEDFLKLQAEQAETKASADHDRRMEEIQAEHEATLARMQAQADINVEMTELQNMLNLELQRLQNEMQNARDSARAVQQLEALQQSGLLTEFTVEVNNDGTPVENVEVTINNATAEAARTVTVSTNAEGQVTFTDVAVGRSVVRMSKPGFVDARFTIQIDPLNTSQTGGYTYVQPRTDFVMVPLFAKSGEEGSTATIKGVVTIETDLTNDAPEVPQELRIHAELDENPALLVESDDDARISSYTFTDESFGSAIVDNATGEYSMTVPATSEGLDYRLLVPELELEQKIAINGFVGDNASNPRYATVPTLFGSNANSDGIPSVNGVKAVFSAPPAAGSGLEFEFAPKPRSLSFYNWSRTPQVNDPFTESEITYELNTRGSGYSSTPTVEITGGGGSGAEMTADIRGYYSSLSTKPGSGYGTEATLYLHLMYKDENGNEQHLNSITFKSTASGEIPSTIEVPANATGFTPENKAAIYEPVSDIFLKIDDNASWNSDYAGAGTGGEVTGDFNGEVFRLRMTNAGEGYTSAPTITFTGGGTTDHADLDVEEFRTRYEVSVANPGSGYVLLPEDITFRYTNRFGIETNDQIEIPNFGYYDINSRLTTNNNGGLRFRDQNEDHLTTQYTSTPPEVIIKPAEPQIAEADVNVNSDGEITGLNNINTGRGYSEVIALSIEPTIAGAPGTGANVNTLSEGNWSQSYWINPTTGEYVWQEGYTIKNGGMGYLSDLNQVGVTPFSISGAQNINNVEPGDIYVININYGTGDKLVNVN